MKRIIIDRKKLTSEILGLLSEKYPDGYGDNDIIEFKNMHNDTIEAVQVETEDTIYLVKVSRKLHQTIVAFDLENESDTTAFLKEDVAQTGFAKGASE